MIHSQTNFKKYFVFFNEQNYSLQKPHPTSNLSDHIKYKKITVYAYCTVPPDGIDFDVMYSSHEKSNGYQIITFTELFNKLVVVL